MIVGSWQVVRISTSAEKQILMDDIETMFPANGTLIVFTEEELLSNGGKRYRSKMRDKDRYVSTFYITHMPNQKNTIHVNLVCIH